MKIHWTDSTILRAIIKAEKTTLKSKTTLLKLQYDQNTKLDILTYNNVSSVRWIKLKGIKGMFGSDSWISNFIKNR